MHPRKRYVFVVVSCRCVSSPPLAGQARARLLLPGRWDHYHFSRAAPIFDRLMGLDRLDYSVTVKLNATPQNSWRWEINCAGRSSPAHKSSVHFSTMGAASRAGKAALKQFLDRSIDTWPAPQRAIKYQIVRIAFIILAAALFPTPGFPLMSYCEQASAGTRASCRKSPPPRPSAPRRNTRPYRSPSRGRGRPVYLNVIRSVLLSVTIFSASGLLVALDNPGCCKSWCRVKKLLNGVRLDIPFSATTTVKPRTFA